MKIVLLIPLIACSLFAQDEFTFKSESQLVEVYATVFDRGAHPVGGLTRDRFEIRDNGAPQSIQVFEPAENTVYCALLLDTTGSMAQEMPALRNAARAFIEVLRPSDSISVFSFNEHVEELSPMSAGKASAHRALARLHAGGRTALFDAITNVALQLERTRGKKAMVVLTDGGDNASLLNRQSAIRRARRTGVPVFAIAQGNALKDAGTSDLLRELAESTGGHMYKVSRPQAMNGVFSEVAGQLDQGYLLAFKPNQGAETTPWHDLEVVVKDAPKTLKVRARTGYSLTP